MIRIGFIGCGGIAREYLQRLADLPGSTSRVRVSAFCDIDPVRAEDLAIQHDARSYTDWREMLERESLDAVFDNLPPFARGDELVWAAERGLHIFTTKPLGLELSIAERTLAAIEAAGVISAVGYMFRYSGITRRARELLGGRPVAAVLGQVIGAMPGGWNARGAMSGGQIVEQSTHIVDLACYLAGEVRTVYARGSTGHATDRVDYEDTTVVSLDFADGAVGTIVSSAAVWQFFWGCSIIARDLHLELVFDRWTIRGRVDGETIDEHIPISGYPEQVEAFVAAVETGDPSPILCSYRDGLGTFAATLAAVRSLATREAVHVARPA